jgi:eukaryotic-like serine/threonine-protein kinase
MTEDQIFLDHGTDSSGPGERLTNAETVECDALFGVARKQVGPYRLIKQIGLGGMGAVYQAEQDEPIHRQVALKIIKPEAVSDSILARFDAERNALALMDHPNIAQVLDAGLAEGERPYFVMELVPGLPITKYCDQHKLDVRERAKLMITVCQAVQHAHQKGIIHRDIKPSNVLVMDSDTGPIPKVIDFGVAKAIEGHHSEKPDLTVAGHAVGTPLYMSPEQAGLADWDVDTRSDVYSLGVLLFELVTGTTPITHTEFREMDPADLRLAVWRGDPPAPSARLRELGSELPAVAEQRGTDSRTLVQAVRHDLDQVVSKATSRDRNQRYATANGLARDLERYLACEPVEATTPSALYRLQRFVRRYRTSLLSASVIACALLTATIVSVWQTYQTAAALRLAEASSRRLAELLYVSDMKVASDAWKDSDPPRVAGLLARHLPPPGTEDLRHFEWHYLSRLVEVDGLQIDMAEDDVESIRYSADGLHLAAGGRDGLIRIYDASSLEQVAAIESGQERVNDLAFSPDGRALATAGQDGTLRIWDLATSALRRTINAHAEPVRGIIYTADGGLLVSCGLDKRIRLWAPENGADQGELEGHGRGVEALALSPDGRLLASAGNDATLRIWDLEQRSQVRSVQLAGARMVCVAFSEDGKLLASGDILGNVILHHLPSETSRILVHLLDGVESLVFLKDDRWLATGDRGGAIQLWPVAGDVDIDVGLGRETYPRWQAHNSRVTALALTPDGKCLVSGSRGGQICRWPSRPATCRWVIGDSDNPVNDFAFFDDGSRMLAACEDALEIWDLKSRKMLQRWADDCGPWTNVAMSPDRSVMVAGNEVGQIVAWDLDTCSELARWTSPDNVEWENLVFAPDGHTFAAAAWDRLEDAWIFDLDDPTWYRQVPARQSDCVAFSPDGQHLAVAWMDDALLYDLASDQEPRRFRGHSSTLSDAAFSPDGSILATVSHDRKLRLWDTQSASEKYAIVAHQDWICSVAFAPDGWSLATAGDDGIVRLWHAKTGQLLLELSKESDGIHGVKYCPTGQCLACRTADDRIVIYDSKPWR